MLLAVGSLGLFLGCHRSVRPSGPSTELAGLRLPLSAEEPGQLLTSGQVGEQTAALRFDLTRAVGSVSASCFPKGVPAAEGTLRLPEPDGKEQAWTLISLDAARVGKTALAPQLVTVSREPKCTLTLGRDVLSAYVLSVDPFRREMGFSLPQPGTAPSGQRLELSRDPLNGWWLLTAQLQHQGQSLLVPFILGSRALHSTLARTVVQAAGWPVEPRLPLGSLALGPAFSLGPVTLDLQPQWSRQSAAGVLSFDVWGRFAARIDLQAGVLWLSCAKAEDLSCFAPSASEVPAQSVPQEAEPTDPSDKED